MREGRRQTCLRGGIGGLACRNASRIDPAHLAGPDPDRRAVLGVHNGIRFHVLGDPEREPQIGQFAGRRRPPGDGCELHLVDHRIVARLHQEPARHRFDRQARGARVRKPARDQEPQVLLCADDRNRLETCVGRDDDFREDLRDGVRRVGVERTV